MAKDEKVKKVYVVVKDRKKRRKRRAKRLSKEEKARRLAEQPRFTGLTPSQQPIISQQLPVAPSTAFRQVISPPISITPAQSGVFQPRETMPLQRPPQPYSGFPTLPALTAPTAPTTPVPPIPPTTLPRITAPESPSIQSSVIVEEQKPKSIRVKKSKLAPAPKKEGIVKFGDVGEFEIGENKYESLIQSSLAEVKQRVKNMQDSQLSNVDKQPLDYKSNYNPPSVFAQRETITQPESIQPVLTDVGKALSQLKTIIQRK